MSLFSHNKCGKITIKHWELDLFFILHFTYLGCPLSTGVDRLRYAVEHSNSGEKSFDSILFDSRYRIDFIRFDSIRQSDKFAACTLIFK